jgi:sugar phosphate isomerase/epimerase
MSSPSGRPRRGLRIGYEALAWGTRVANFVQAWRIVERANHAHLGLIATGYTGTVSVEIFNELTLEAPLETARAALRSLLLVEEAARRPR